jgi:hypothetical protein
LDSFLREISEKVRKSLLEIYVIKRAYRSFQSSLRFFLTTKQMYSIVHTQFGVISSEYKLKVKYPAAAACPEGLWLGEG